MSDQKLIDIMFEVGLTIHNDPFFAGLENEEIAQWIRKQLSHCGYDVVPVGASHGVLKEKNELL